MVPRHAQDRLLSAPEFLRGALKIEGKTVRKVAQAEVSGLAEGIAFTLDGVTSTWETSSTATSTSCGSMATR
jgi:hypothetical protein